jgi:hypothetical protein
MVVP